MASACMGDIAILEVVLRDRGAHHGPLVNGIPLPGENRRITPRTQYRRVLIRR